MRLRNQLYTLSLVAAFWSASVFLTMETSLLRPYFRYERSYGLLTFIVVHAGLCGLYAAALGKLSVLSRREALVLGLLCGVGLELFLLFFEMQPVMLAELVGNRLFYFYFLGLGYAVSAAFTILSAYLIYQTGRSLLTGSVHLSIFFLPIALLGIYPHYSYLPAIGLATVGVALWQRVNGRRARPILQRLNNFGRLSRMSVDDRSFVVALFVLAFLLRAAYSIRTAETERAQGFIWDDAVIYENGARDLSYEGYSIFLRGIYAIAGHSFAAVGLVQSVLGAATCVLVFLIARDLLDRRVARLTGMLCVIFGAQLFLPAMHARETLLSFGMVAAVYAAFRLERVVSRDAIIGISLGLLGLVKVLVFPIALPIAFYRWKSAAAIRGALVSVMIGAAIVGTKFFVNRPLNVPVGKSTSEYAALAYFAGNHPFSREEEWFNLTRENYSQLKAMGFNVSDQAGDPEIVASWKERYPRIAYCDKMTFETNTWNLLRYNLSHPRRMAATHLENLIAFFLGSFRHHRVFDPIFLLNQSAFSMVFRVYWLVLLGLGWLWAWAAVRHDRIKRAKLFLIGAVVLYIVLIHTAMIGTTVYAIPIIPFMLILQSAAFLRVYEQIRALAGRLHSDEVSRAPVSLAARPPRGHVVPAFRNPF